MVSFPNGITLTVLLLLSYFFWRKYLLYNDFASIGKLWSCCCLSFHWLPVKLKRGPFFFAYLMTILILIGTVFVIIWEMFHGRIYLNLVLLLLVNFAVVFRLDWMHISHRKYLVRPHSSPWFSSACGAAIAHRNHFFVCNNKINLSNLK